MIEWRLSYDGRVFPPGKWRPNLFRNSLSPYSWQFALSYANWKGNFLHLLACDQLRHCSFNEDDSRTLDIRLEYYSPREISLPPEKLQWSLLFDVRRFRSTLVTLRNHIATSDEAFAKRTMGTMHFYDMQSEESFSDAIKKFIEFFCLS